jgi:hypothetical protein
MLEYPGAGTARCGSVLDENSGTRSWEIPFNRPRGLILLVSFFTLLFLTFFIAAALDALLH